MDNFLVFWFVSVPLIFCRLLNDVFLLPKQVLLSGGAVILFVCLLQRLRGRNYNLLLEPFFWPLTAIVLTRIFSLTAAVNKHATLYSIAEAFSFLILVLSLTEFLQDEKNQTKVLLALASVSLLVCLYGLFQLAGLDFFTWEVPAGSGRSTLSTLGRRNFTAEYLVAVVPLIFFLWTRSDCRKEKILAGISFSSGVVTLFLSFTRASYLGFFASFLVAAAFLFRGKVAFQKTFILLAVVVFFRSGLAAGQPMGFDPTSVKSRLLIWKAALAMVKEKPLTGVGANNFEFVYLPYAKKAKGLLPVAERVANAHNDYLEVAAEQGVLGLAALFWLIFVLINTGLEVRKKGNRQQQFFTVAALSSCAGILINSLAAFPFKNPSVLQILAFNLAILTVFHHQVRKKGGCSVALRPATVRIISAVSLTVFSLSAAASLASSYLLKKALRLMSSAGETQDPVSWALAENSGRKAVLFNPYSLEAHFYLGRIYLSGNYPELAREELSAALQLAPCSDTVANNLAIACHRLNQLKEAEKYYRYSLQLNPNRPETYNNLGFLYLEEGKKETALFYLKKARQMEKIYPER